VTSSWFLIHTELRCMVNHTSDLELLVLINQIYYHLLSLLIWNSTQQQEQMVVDPVNRYQKLYLQLYQLLMMGVNTRNM